MLDTITKYFDAIGMTTNFIMTGHKEPLDQIPQTSSGSGSDYGFIKEAEGWKVELFDEVPNAFSLCTFHDRDLQCDFNSPFWAVQDCSWRYNKTLAKEIGLESNETFVRILAEDELTFSNYWRPQNVKSDNYILIGPNPGSYHLVSPILREFGPRQHHPHFGFVYRGDHGQMKVIFIEDQDPTKKHEIFSTQLEANVWTYFSKNLSEVEFIQNAWYDTPTEPKEWQIVLEFIVEQSGNIAIDNLGPCALEEVFFPSESGKMIGSCYRIEGKGKARFHDVDDLCLSSTARGSVRASFSRRDPEFELLKSFLEYHNQNGDSL